MQLQTKEYNGIVSKMIQMKIIPLKMWLEYLFFDFTFLSNFIYSFVYWFCTEWYWDFSLVF